MKSYFPYLLPVLLLLGACTAPPSRPTPGQFQDWELRVQRLAALSQWQLQGRVSIHTDFEAWTGDLDWQQQGQDYAMRFIAPLGAGTLHIRTVSGGVMVEDSRQPEPVFSTAPQQWLREQMGWQIPLDSLRYWVVGIPDPRQAIHANDMRFDAEGQLSGFRQSGWQVSIERYTEIGPYLLPRRIDLEQGELGLRMVIRRWNVEG